MVQLNHNPPFAPGRDPRSTDEVELVCDDSWPERRRNQRKWRPSIRNRIPAQQGSGIETEWESVNATRER